MSGLWKMDRLTMGGPAEATSRDQTNGNRENPLTTRRIGNQIRLTPSSLAVATAHTVGWIHTGFRSLEHGSSR